MTIIVITLAIDMRDSLPHCDLQSTASAKKREVCRLSPIRNGGTCLVFVELCIASNMLLYELGPEFVIESSITENADKQPRLPPMKSGSA